MEITERDVAAAVIGAAFIPVCMWIGYGAHALADWLFR